MDPEKISDLVSTDLEESADLWLPIRLEPAILSGNQGNPLVEVHWADITDTNTLTVGVSNFDALKGLENLSLQAIIGALRSFRTFLDEHVKDSELLATKLPLINRSISDLIDVLPVLDDLIETLEDNQGATLQEIKDKLAGKFGVDLVNNVFEINVNTKIDLFDTELPLNLDLVDLGGAGHLITTEGALKAEVQAVLEPRLCDRSGCSRRPGVLRQGYNQRRSRRASPSPRQRHQSRRRHRPAGDFRPRRKSHAGRRRGWFRALVCRVGSGSGPRGRARTELSELGIDVLDVGLEGEVDVDLPLYFPTASEPLVDPNGVSSIKFTIDSLADFLDNPKAFTFTLPDFAAIIDEKIPNLADNLSAMVSSWEGFFTLLEEVADGEVFGVELPLIGDGLAEGAEFILDLRRDVVDQLKSRTDATINEVQLAFYDALGPGGLDWLKDIAGGPGGPARRQHHVGGRGVSSQHGRGALPYRVGDAAR